MKKLSAVFIASILLIAGPAACKASADLSSSEQTADVSASRYSAIAAENNDPEPESLSQAEPQLSETEGETMKIRVTAGETAILYELNDSQAAKELYAQLPLTLESEDFSTNEKVFYPPERLNTADAPAADAEKGTLAYYAPWGDVVMFYDHFGSGSGLYELGYAVSGGDLIETLSGTIAITAAE